MILEMTEAAPESTEGMTGRQWIAIWVCVFLNVIDGFDILAMSTAAGAVRQDFGLSAQTLGLILSASLAGMMLGALLVSPLADRYGRRKLILLCLAVEIVGMAASGLVGDAQQLIACRVVTGLGVGAMMPVLNTIVAEVSTSGRRNVAITMQAAGYPAGGLVAALMGLVLLDGDGWRLLVQSACAPTAAALVLVALFLPESVSFLLARPPPNALARVNAALRTLGRAPVSDLRSEAKAHASQPPHGLFSGAQGRALLLFATATFLTQFSFYFFLSWLPTVLQPHFPTAFPKSAGAMALNMGGIVGDLVFGVLCLKIRARTLTLWALAVSFLSTAVAGQFLQAPTLAMALVLLAGAALFAAMAGVYATAPEAFPAGVRASGTGWAFSLGRLGGALSPAIGAVLISGSQPGLTVDLVIMAAPLIGAAILLRALSNSG